MSDELHLKYRPKTFDELSGQPEAVSILKGFAGNYPHCLLFTGPSGCGKTTTARILRRELGCKSHDFQEINCADFRGIDGARDIRRQMVFSPIGKCKIWLLDECHKSTNDFQNSMLKMLEDTPPTVYFFLATTDPKKLIPTVRSRCTEIRMRSLTETELAKLIRAVAAAEKITIALEISVAIAEQSEGSARAALRILNSIRGITDPKAQAAAVLKNETQNEAIEIARALMNPRTRWADMAKILKGADIEDPEGIRRLILAYCASILLSGKDVGRAAMILDYCGKPWFDSGKSGLTLAAWEILHSKT